MGETNERKTRRDFIKSAGTAAGALAVATTLGEAEKAQAHEVEINAMSPRPEQMQKFLALPDGPVVMVNLLKFKPDGGAAEYAKYAEGVQPILEKIGAKLLFMGQAKVCLLGNGDWDAVALVEYPDKTALIRMSQSAEYQAIHHHRAAGLEGQINYAVIQGPMA